MYLMIAAEVRLNNEDCDDDDDAYFILKTSHLINTESDLQSDHPHLLISFR